MGLLDDAIREHLDLKRRRGADPTEVEREEREVLGPVRRRGEAHHDDEHDLGHGQDDDLEHEPLPHDSVSGHDSPSEEPARAERPAPTTAFDQAEHLAQPGRQPEPYGHEPGLYASEPGPYGDEPRPYVPIQRDREPEPHPAAARPEPSATSDITVEHRLEDIREEDHSHREGDVPRREGESPPREGEKEDVLEETPEFLQDTPDHDRLWFEQRPPRDFDFDG